MTLQNLRYIIEISRHKSFSEAANALFLTQSALSAAVKDVENELGIRIFNRTSRGIEITPEGEDCIRYCREIVDQADFLTQKYRKKDGNHVQFSVSSQHLPFAVRAFNDFLNECGSVDMKMSFRESPTQEVLENVRTGRSEIGVLALPENQLKILSRTFRDRQLNFTKTDWLKKYVFLRREHPLSHCRTLTLEQLSPYPFVTYDRISDPICYSEEFVRNEPIDKCIYVSDRATKMSIIRSTDAFSIGVDLPNFNEDIYFHDSSAAMIAIPWEDRQDPVLVGCLTRIGTEPSEACRKYMELLKKHTRMLKLPLSGRN